MNKDEALKMAIEFMETLTIDIGIKTWNEKHRKQTIQACKEALEQPSWQELSDDEILEIDISIDPEISIGKGKTLFARAIEQALKEKNT